MGYISDNLLPDEKIKYFARLHWIIFLGPTLFFIFALMAFSGGKEPAGAGPGLLLIAIIWGCLRFITFTTSEFGLTNKRVIIKVGFIRRRSLEMLIPKIETIGVNQGILGRVLNFGTIVVAGSGGTREFFSKIAAPILFRKNVLSEISGLK